MADEELVDPEDWADSLISQSCWETDIPKRIEWLHEEIRALRNDERKEPQEWREVVAKELEDYIEELKTR